jgi:hypothetical protein
MTASEPEPLLTLDQAYRATFHFIHQYYRREPIEPFVLMLHSMMSGNWKGGPRETNDPATWDDWVLSVQAALASEELPNL